MCFTATPRQSFRRLRGMAETYKYRRYAEAKRKIPMDLPPKEYEAEINKLIRRYKI